MTYQKGSFKTALNQSKMKEMFSDCLTSETRREGLKEISISIHNLLLVHKDITYREILDNIDSSNINTLRRRVYDVLSVMRALNMIVKNKKSYSLISKNTILEKKTAIKHKTEKLDELKHLQKVFEFIVRKNISRKFEIIEDKYFIPFMVVVIEKESNAHCETNEERTSFKFKSNRPIKLIEDLEILKELYKKNNDPDPYIDTLEKFKESFSGIFDNIR